MPPFSVEQLIAFALSHHQAGRFAEAEAIYRKILSEVPAHPLALDYLGVLALQTNRLELAAAILQQAIRRCRPTSMPTATSASVSAGSASPRKLSPNIKRRFDLSPASSSRTTIWGSCWRRPANLRPRSQPIARRLPSIPAMPRLTPIYATHCSILAGPRKPSSRASGRLR